MANPNPLYALILIGEDGKVYKLTQDQWQVQSNLLPEDAPGQVPIKQLVSSGTYLANIQSPGLGIGSICILVNAPAILGKTNNT